MPYPYERRVLCHAPLAVKFPPADIPPEVQIQSLTVEPNSAESVILTIGKERVVVRAQSLVIAMDEMIDAYSGRLRSPKFG